VSVEAVTWSRESYGLFDYESQHVSRRNLKASSSAKIIRVKNDIRLVTDMYNERNVCENSKTLALLKHQDGMICSTLFSNFFFWDNC
jgi:acetyl-CoA acetyltransferase